MNNGASFLLSRAVWTIGSYGASLTIRLATNVVLSRLLAPEILGIMVVANSVKYGVELLTDVGVEQNIVHNQDGKEPVFINTAWTIQIIRGLCLTLLFLALSLPLSQFFGIDQSIFLVISFAPLFNSLASTSIFILVKDLHVKKRNLFELTSEALAFCVTAGLAMITRNIWALVFGSLCAVGMRAALSYTLPHPPHRLLLDRRYTREILTFGKWIVVSSFLIYASTNIDRLYLGKTISFQLLGIYGLARTISDLPAILANKLSYQLLFPVLAAARAANETLGAQALTATRWKFVILASIALGSATAWSDLAVHILYDSRYQEAGWMLFLLLISSWFAVLSNLNESTLLAFGKPAYNSLSNSVRLVVLAIGLTLVLPPYGLAGAIIMIIVSELIRFLFVLFGQSRVGLTYFRQDAASTLVFIIVIVGWAWLRLSLGLGEAWKGLL